MFMSGSGGIYVTELEGLWPGLGGAPAFGIG